MEEVVYLYLCDIHRKFSFALSGDFFSIPLEVETINELDHMIMEAKIPVGLLKTVERKLCRTTSNLKA